jgi:hypothetical protein
MKMRGSNKKIKSKDHPEESPLSPEEKYIEHATRKFRPIFLEDIYNENIDPIFFDRKSYSEMIKIPNSELELKWRRRIIFEPTPRGNVIMFYDSYKQGFSYYSDQFIPYTLLNAIAMKYVMIYRCRDFFMDEQVNPTDFPSRILEHIKIYEQELLKKDKEPVNQIDTKSGPFAKFRSYSKSTDPVIAAALSSNKIKLPNITDSKKTGQIKTDVIKNKFINLGKTMNWNILNVPPKKNAAFSKGKMEKDLEQNSDVQSRIFSYKDFKQNLAKG